MSEAALVLLGSPVSNYVNIVRAALLEKGLPHEHRSVAASQEADFLARSPMGKVPVLETGEGPLAETVAILDYLDDRYPQQPLRPEAAFARARMRQAINVVQVYIEVPARALYPHVFAGAAFDAAIADAVRATLDRATEALRRLIGDGQFLCGSAVTQLDLFLFHTLALVDRVCDFVWQRSLADELGAVDWHAAMAARPSSIAVRADFAPALASYLDSHGASARAREMFADA